MADKPKAEPKSEVPSGEQPSEPPSAGSAPVPPAASTTAAPPEAAASAKPGESLVTTRKTPLEVPANGHERSTSGAYGWLLTLTALGVVYGDIGTSPLYAVKECFTPGPHGLPLTTENIFGVLSLITWSLILVVSVKYLAFVMRADNKGEGGALALMALILRSPSHIKGPNGAPAKRRPFVQYAIISLAIFGGALLYGDGAITPAISVLSAMEGLVVIEPHLEKFVLPLTIVILIVLFVVQRKGTARVGVVFGPVMLVWFFTIGALGAVEIASHPAILAALSPWWGVKFFIEHGFHGIVVLGAVFLVVTGGESLYTDMGHFGRKPIRRAWFIVALPGLLLNYFGQGGLLLADASAKANPFFLLAPAWARVPLVILAAMAACIASQAVISGAFSLTRQAVQLGYCPRLEILHTSEKEIGQIYIPTVNWALFIGVIALVVGFRSATNLAGAYGIAVSGAMIITTLMSYFVVRDVWAWNRLAAIPLLALFFLIDVSFFGANVLKVLDGGYVPLILAAGVFTLMTTWKKGRMILAERMRKSALPLDLFLGGFNEHPPIRVPGTAVFMTGNPEGVPPALLHNLKHNKVLHERVVLLTITTQDVPKIEAKDRVTVEELPMGIWRVICRYGFTENPNVPDILQRCRDQGLKVKMSEATFFLGRETLIPSRKKGMAIWREALFAWMSRNARAATAFFNIPPNRVVELGAQIEL